MTGGWWRAGRVLVLVLVVAGSACAGPGSSGGRLWVVAGLYPLAWAAQQVGGDRVQVRDLTPAGTEAHDTTLTAAQRAELTTAALVLYLGDLGFQPDVERAVAQARGRVVAATAGLGLLGSSEHDLRADPHVWLDPVLMQQLVRRAADGLVAVDPEHEGAYRDHEDAALPALGVLNAAYRRGLAGCAFTTLVVTHEAFGHLAARYGLRQLGIERLTPESEPSASRIQAAARAIEQGLAAPVVFYEATDEGRRVGHSVASSLGVAALPLGTLESVPASGDYRSVMRDNLSDLREGLRCGT